MSDEPDWCSDRVAKQKRDLAKTLAELGVTHEEASLFLIINYHISAMPESLCQDAASECYRLGDTSSLADSSAALSACFAKGWLRVINEAALAEIVAGVRADNYLGPIYGLPQVGHVDFTQTGADLWLQISSRKSHQPFAYSDVVHEKTARYFRTRALAVAEAESAATEDDVVAVSDLTPTGPWRAEWWQRFPEGYRIVVEQRRQWQGRSMDSNEWTALNRDFEEADPLRLRQALERHNVAYAEWAGLASLGYGPYRFDSLSMEAEVTEPDSKRATSVKVSRAGLEANLRLGRVRALDQQAIDEVRATLRDDPTILALPRTAKLRPDGCAYEYDSSQPWNRTPVPPRDDQRWGEIDFTPAGAALYRAIMADWLGPNWEDDLMVSHGYYWEEHRYCEFEEGFQNIRSEYEAQGMVVRAVRTVPIGPWCTFWWARFPSGYRMELEIMAEV